MPAVAVGQEQLAAQVAQVAVVQDLQVHQDQP
jgi:hypothetical protein